MQKDKILEHAEKIFFAQRYSQISLDQLAHDLDMKKPSLYYYFKNKQMIFLEVLDYSQKRFFASFNKILKTDDIKKLVERYLTYPAQEKNLFAIAAQKWYCAEAIFGKKIAIWKQKVLSKLEEHFSSYNIKNERVYLLMNLLEKLAMNNCSKDYCLNHEIWELVSEIENIFMPNCD